MHPEGLSSLSETLVAKTGRLRKRPTITLGEVSAKKHSRLALGTRPQ
jgi:hypothetical protein